MHPISGCLFGFPTQASLTFHPSEVGELVLLIPAACMQCAGWDIRNYLPGYPHVDEGAIFACLARGNNRFSATSIVVST